MKTKKIIVSFSIIMAIVAIVATATRAYFSDVENVTGNTFSAGTLDLKTNDADGLTEAYSISSLKPGDWNLTGQVTLKNAGDVKGHAWLEIKNVENYENMCIDPETKAGDVTCSVSPDQGELGSLVKASFQKNIDPWSRYGGTDSINASEGQRVDLFDLNAGESVPLVLYAVWPNSTDDNLAQGDSTKFDVVFHLDQVAP
jgi:predicted ribosomally synthesized peptide with SipW-like signal peptide